VLASESEPGARNQYITALDALLGKQATRAIRARSFSPAASASSIATYCKR
jgi:hypothetical protein